MAGRRQNPNSLINNDAALQPGSHTSTPETKLRIAQVAEKISKGWTKFEVEKWVKEQFNVKDSSANRYWNAALATLALDAHNSEHVEEMRKKILVTLDRALQSEVEQGRYKEMNQTADLISRLMGFQAPQKIEAKVDSEIHFNFGGVPNEENE